MVVVVRSRSPDTWTNVTDSLGGAVRPPRLGGAACSPGAALCAPSPALWRAWFGRCAARRAPLGAARAALRAVLFAGAVACVLWVLCGASRAARRGTRRAARCAVLAFGLLAGSAGGARDGTTGVVPHRARSRVAVVAGSTGGARDGTTDVVPHRARSRVAVVAGSAGGARDGTTGVVPHRARSPPETEAAAASPLLPWWVMLSRRSLSLFSVLMPILHEHSQKPRGRGF